MILGQYNSVLLFLGVIVLCIQMSSCDQRLNRRKRFIEMGDDIRGPYCETKPGGSCCPGRDDQCTVPILDSYCYCDMFCNFTASDCCPDFWRVCHGGGPEPITRGCKVNGIEFRVGSVFKENCNQCTCITNPSLPNRVELRCTNEVCLIQPGLIERINNDVNQGWKASNYSFFWGKTLNEGVRHRLGTMPPGQQVLNMNPVQMDSVDEPPVAFDSRDKWPNFVHPVRDQGECGASWAFSTAAVASDRLAIESEGVLPEELSPQHLISCNDRGQSGCEGGYLDKAWWFLRKNGIVTDSCYPYESGTKKSAGYCKLRSRNYKNITCPNDKENKLDKILHSTPPYRIRSDEREIMMEIMKNGPVQAILKVKEDFFMYKSGVYSYSRIPPDNLPDDDKGYHSIRIIGWGEERRFNGATLKYWLGANTWGSEWGEGGYVKISRGSDECKVESCIVSSWGSITSGMMLRVP